LLHAETIITTAPHPHLPPSHPDQPHTTPSEYLLLRQHHRVPVLALVELSGVDQPQEHHAPDKVAHPRHHPHADAGQQRRPALPPGRGHVGAHAGEQLAAVDHDHRERGREPHRAKHQREQAGAGGEDVAVACVCGCWFQQGVGG